MQASIGVLCTTMPNLTRFLLEFLKGFIKGNYMRVLWGGWGLRWVKYRSLNILNGVLGCVVVEC